MEKETVIRKAEFNPKVRIYWILSSCVIFAVTIIGIPLLVIWIPTALFVAGRYLRSLELVLTTKAVRVKKGVLFRVEKTIPLDKITDLGLSQGPLMRALGLEHLTIETAGSTAPGALVAMPGVVNAREFRDAVLAQKDELIDGRAGRQQALPSGAGEPSGGGSETDSVALLKDISETLKRIEGQLSKEGG